jgi:phosphatidate cytidylyltransferase
MAGFPKTSFLPIHRGISKPETKLWGAKIKMTISWSGLATRVMTALVMMTIFMALTWIPGTHWIFACAVAVFVVLGVSELNIMFVAKGEYSPHKLGTPVAAGIVLAGALGGIVYLNTALFVGIIILFFAQIVTPPVTHKCLTNTLFGLVYLPWFGGHLMLVHGTEEIGPGLVTLLVFIVSGTDVGAYFVGKTMGKHKMAPVVSPNKTWEGAFGGLGLAVAAMAVAYALKQKMEWTALPDWSLAKYALIGLVLSTVSQVGDLVESSLKRDAAIKDSGSILPGHGGILDRCDGFLFAIPGLYYLLQW